MNKKMRVNRHFNAEPSRGLTLLLDEIKDAQRMMTKVGHDFKPVAYYETLIDNCLDFLAPIGGNHIPEEFERITLIRYEQAFVLTNAVVAVPAGRAHVALTMIGEGSYAHVYRYMDPFYSTPFAIKRAKRSLDDHEMERFRREFEILHSLRFPYVLQVFQYDESMRQYTMECCDSTLDKFVDSNNSTLPFSTRKRIALQFLYGISYIHSKGYLHRDLSYGNILLKEYDGRAVVVKLSDFGLAKDPESHFTRTGSEVRGTIVDPALTSFREYALVNEIYPIGFLLAFTFSGRRGIRRNIGQVDPIIERCVTRDLASRYPDVRSIIRDVEALHVGLEAVQPGTPA